MAIIQLTQSMTEQEEKETQNSNNVFLDTTKVPTSRTVNGKALSANITLSPPDVGALSSSIVQSGTFTPAFTVIGTGTFGTATYTAASGSWERIGKMVDVWIDLSVSSASGWSGTFGIAALPFTVNSPTSAGEIAYITGVTATGMIVVRTNPSIGSKSLSLNVINNGNTSTQIPWSAISGTSFSISFHIRYKTNDA